MVLGGLVGNIFIIERFVFREEGMDESEVLVSRKEGFVLLYLEFRI